MELVSKIILACLCICLIISIGGFILTLISGGGPLSVTGMILVGSEIFLATVIYLFAILVVKIAEPLNKKIFLAFITIGILETILSLASGGGIISLMGTGGVAIATILAVIIYYTVNHK